ncbi:ATP-binding protein [Ottowia thiooxydans]|uniref:ATP-binding protein n=1 Tax=Ottowia thiooxydans TaxID=219182 RepID=UPI0003FAB72B|nr:ATP-binding protein [Ottowia thiooxydans]
MADEPCAWARLTVPSEPGALGAIQALLLSQAQAHRFAKVVLIHMRAACDEALTTILRLSQDNSEDADRTLEVNVEWDGHALHLRLSDHGLPYDMSLLPSYSPQQPESADDNLAGLAAFLMQKMADHCQVHNHGSLGHHVELQWFLPEAELNAATDETGANDRTGSLFVAPAAILENNVGAPLDAIEVRPLETNDAIHLARLVYRSYGYSYVNPDMYIAERILARVQDGRLTSWVAVTPGSEGDENLPVGHIAFMKSHRDDDTLEVGSAVVSPDQRGGGLLGRLLSIATDALAQRPERAAFVHAVTAHPFTQKTFGRLGYLPTALMLAYTPASLRFRSIGEKAGAQRGSVYYACKLLRPVEPVKAYVPLSVQALVLPRAADIGLPLQLQPIEGSTPQGDTDLLVQAEDTLNSAFLTLRRTGEDFSPHLRRVLRRLCRAQVAVIYLSLDLSDPATPSACEQAMAQGFIAAGLTPFMPWPATLCLQYLNNQSLDPDAVCAVGEAAEHLRDTLFAAYQAQEML